METSKRFLLLSVQLRLTPPVQLILFSFYSRSSSLSRSSQHQLLLKGVVVKAKKSCQDKSTTHDKSDSRCTEGECLAKPDGVSNECCLAAVTAAGGVGGVKRKAAEVQEEQPLSKVRYHLEIFSLKLIFLNEMNFVIRLLLNYFLVSCSSRSRRRRRNSRINLHRHSSWFGKSLRRRRWIKFRRRVGSELLQYL